MAIEATGFSRYLTTRLSGLCHLARARLCLGRISSLHPGHVLTRERIASYIDWTSPSLLTLPYLDDGRRRRLEERLSRQAISIEYHWRLYPKILDADKLIAARVQARLQSSGHAVS